MRIRLSSEYTSVADPDPTILHLCGSFWENQIVADLDPTILHVCVSFREHQSVVDLDPTILHASDPGATRYLL